LLDTDEQIKQYEADYLQPAQLLQVQKQVEVLNREITDKEATSSMQRSDIMKGVELKQQQLVNLTTEDRIAAQRIVGRAQSIVNKE
jgi:non-homologous end joining protein Ku